MTATYAQRRTIRRAIAAERAHPARGIDRCPLCGAWRYAARCRTNHGPMVRVRDGHITRWVSRDAARYARSGDLTQTTYPRGA